MYLLLSKILNSSDHSVELVSHGLSGNSSSSRFEVLQGREGRVEVRTSLWGRRGAREREEERAYHGGVTSLTGGFDTTVRREREGV